MRNAIMLCLFTLITAPALTAQELSHHNFKITRASQSELLTQQTIRQSFQDSQGLMWFLTQEGLHRFDGYTVTRYTANEEDAGSITHNNVRQILEDKLGTIWIATTGGGLISYNPKTRSYSKLTEDPQGNSLLSENISAIFEDDAGLIWIGYLEGKVSYYDPLEKTLHHIQKLNHSEDHYGAILDFAQHSYRNIWIATREGGLLSYQRFQNKLHHYRESADDSYRIHSNNLSSIAADRINKQLWIGTESDGLVRLDIESGERRQFGLNEGLSDTSINDIYFDHNMRLWLATDKGLNLKRADNSFLVFDKSNSNLTDDLVFSVYQDQQDNFWIGTHYGLFAGYISQFDIFDATNGLPSETVTSFTETEDGSIWVATYDGVFERIDAQENFQEVSAHFNFFRLRERKAMAIGSISGDLLVGYRAMGLDLIDTKRELVQHFSDTGEEDNRISHNQITSILKTGPNEAWVTTFGGGVNRIRLSDQASTRTILQGAAGRSSKERIFAYQVEPTDEGYIHIATTNGLLKFHPKTGNYERIFSGHGSSIQIEHENILSIHEAADGDIWLGLQYNGLAHWSKESRDTGTFIFHRVVTTPKIPSNTVYAIQEDDHNRLWLSTTNGLVRLQVQDKEIWPYFQNNGLQGDEFNFGASFKDSKGRLYFGGNRGYNRFHPDDIVDDRTPPQLSMTDIRVGGKSWSEDTAHFLPERIELKYGDYYIDFDFSVMDYSNPRKNQYKYKLANFDSDWVDIGSRRSITFTNLPSGDYVLQIMGANPNRVWSTTPLSTNLYVHPPPWYTWWAFAAYLFLVLCFAAMAKKNYDTNILRMRAERLAESLYITAEAATDSFQEKLNMEQNLLQNIHVYYTGGLDLVVQLLAHQADEIQDEVLLEQFSNNQQRIQCLYEIENNLIYLGPMLQVNFHKFIDTLFSQHQTIHKVSGLGIPLINTCSSNPIPAFLAAPLAIIANELVDNAFRYAFENPTGVEFVKVHFGENEEHTCWMLEVIDNGCGIPKSIDPDKPLTMGLTLVNQFTKRLNGTLTLDQRESTHFTVRFPLPDIRAYDGS